MQPTKNTLLKNAKANAASIFFKRVFFTPPRQEFYFFSPSLRCFSFFCQRTVYNWTDIASNLKHLAQGLNKLDTSPLRADRRASGNSGFKKLAVQWLNEVQFSNQTFVVEDSFVLRNRQLLKPAKRYKP